MLIVAFDMLRLLALMVKHLAMFILFVVYCI
jgi:hypothetical protein